MKTPQAQYVSLRVFLLTVAFLLGLITYIDFSLSNTIETATNHIQVVERQRDTAYRKTLFDMLTESEDRVFKVIALQKNTLKGLNLCAQALDESMASCEVDSDQYTQTGDINVQYNKPNL
ncbi:hypothetical protein [Pseudomonas simiae]|uniref:hypothetical protein n=1 Tax=Pseudomonas simiae TaxID=321846 RepID=UPI0016543689|nr:hypothetical protein [Pseudomonas simiae]MBC3965349.1 hypothetical protein [Pseudomonas simiae]UNK68476.1 hypothetical protein MNO08_10425 [Pseudomonas simiae]WLG36109.1 hypothetical protein PSH82_10165 [Pseudomonas simiae]WLI26044.1 hypothetical protein PSH85_10190 [Pseudomonas simiae]